MTPKPLTLAAYLDEQSRRFEFANHMTICEGSDSYKPKYTLARIADEASTAEDFIREVDEAIVAKLHFNIDTTDKANLLSWWHSKSNKVVDEAQIVGVDSDMLDAIAHVNNITVSRNNNCMVFESAKPASIRKFIEDVAQCGTNIDEALETSLVDSEGIIKCSLSNTFITD